MDPRREAGDLLVSSRQTFAGCSQETPRRCRPVPLVETQKTGLEVTLNEPVTVKLTDTVLRLSQRVSLSSALISDALTAELAALGEEELRVNNLQRKLCWTAKKHSTPLERWASADQTWSTDDRGWTTVDESSSAVRGVAGHSSRASSLVSHAALLLSQTISRDPCRVLLLLLGTTWPSGHWSDVPTMLQFIQMLTNSLGPGPILLLLDCAPVLHTIMQFRTAAKHEFFHLHTMFFISLATRAPSGSLTSPRTECSSHVSAHLAPHARGHPRRSVGGRQPQGQQTENPLAAIVQEAITSVWATFSLAWRHLLVARKELTQILAGAKADCFAGQFFRTGDGQFFGTPNSWTAALSLCQRTQIRWQRRQTQESSTKWHRAHKLPSDGSRAPF